MTYGASLWGDDAAKTRMKILLLRAQRKALLSVTGAYCTTSTDALPVLAGVLPLDLEVRRCCLLARSRSDGNGGRESEKRIKEDMVRVWQERWTGSAKGIYL
jgi:hypothetical protein